MSESLKNSITYDWQKIYLSAMLETDFTKLSSAIDLAIKTLLQRQKQVVSADPNAIAEIHALSDALQSLRMLRRSTAE